MTGIAWKRLTGSLALLALVPSARLTAQHGAGAPGGEVDWGALDGDIVGIDGQALLDVEIVPLDAPKLAVRSGPGGGFRIDSLPDGPHLIRFRRVGLAPITVPVTIQPHDVVSADVVLGPVSTRLANVVIQGQNGELTHLPFGVADRARNGFGHYITGTDIERMHPIQTGDVLRRIAGLQVVGPPGRQVVFNTRGSSAVWDQVDPKGNHVMSANCTEGMPVYVDGAEGNLDAVQPSEIALIEAYKDAAEIPVTLPRSPCGAIFIWTK